MTKFTRPLMFALLLCFGAGATLAQTRAYVVNAHSDSVSVIDTATFSVIATIPVGSSPSDVAVTPNGRFVYVANFFGNSVSVISAATNTVVATIPMGTFVRGMAMNPNGSFAYVLGGSSANISVIDTATNTVVSTIPVSSASKLAIAPSGNLGYVTHGAFIKGVTVINTATNSVVTHIPIPVDVTDAPAVTPDGAFLYVTCQSFSTGPKLAVIDTATNTLVALVPLPGNFAPGIAITPNGALAYVASNGGGVCCDSGRLPSSVSVIDTATNTEVANVPFGSLSPLAVAVTPDGAFVYVTDLSENTVRVISTTSNFVVAVLPVGLFPQGIAIGTFVPEPDPEPEPDPIESLTEQVEALIAGGALTQNQGGGLIDKIQEISAKIDAGQTAAACNQVVGLINQVNGFISNGILTPAQGQPLIDTANALKTNLGC
ncbi:MAG TPA: YncE family protein, partial [Pyrinomonadaceae bacterium]|nr:YncE family protein [Pyrinomonadaceae bacterium]